MTTIPAALLTAVSGSRALDAEIARALGWKAPNELGIRWRRPDGKYDEVPRWSTDLSCAVTLVETELPGCSWVINSFDVQVKPTRVRVVKVHLSSYAGAGRGALGSAPAAPLALLKALFAARGEGEAG